MSRRDPATLLRTCLLQWARQRLTDWPASSLPMALWYGVDSVPATEGREGAWVDRLLALFTPDEREAVGADAVRAIGRVLGTADPSARTGTVRP